MAADQRSTSDCGKWLIPAAILVSTMAFAGHITATPIVANIEETETAKAAHISPVTPDEAILTSSRSMLQTHSMMGRFGEVQASEGCNANKVLPARTTDPLSLIEVLSPRTCRAPFSEVFVCPACSQRLPLSTSPLFTGLSILSPVAEDNTPTADIASHNDSPVQKDQTSGRATLEASLQSPVLQTRSPWQFEGNGGRGVKTWLSEAHVLEINPQWLNFAMFDSMDLSMTDQPPGPGQSEPQEWRSAFTVGMSTDWQFTQAMTMHAGYRFYDNPVPDNIASGAFPNASQHVVAMGMTLHEGRHSVSLVYGLDMMTPSSSSGISSDRHGDNIDPLAHLVSFSYGFTF